MLGHSHTHAPGVTPGVKGRWQQRAKSCAHLPSCTGTTYEVRQGCRRTLHQTSLLFAEREAESPCTQESRAPTAPAVLRRGARRRGGSAKGRGWWEAGRRIRKQNSYDDFAACADYLIDGGITSPNGLAIVVRALTLPSPCPSAAPQAALGLQRRSLAARWRSVRSCLLAARRASGSTPVPAPPRVAGSKAVGCVGLHGLPATVASPVCWLQLAWCCHCAASAAPHVPDARNPDSGPLVAHTDRPHVRLGRALEWRAVGGGH